jgi:hypothetical protein
MFVVAVLRVLKLVAMPGSILHACEFSVAIASAVSHKSPTKMLQKLFVLSPLAPMPVTHE